MFKGNLVIFIALACSFGTSDAIFDGVPVIAGNFKWLARIDTAGVSGRFVDVCAGSLITPIHVLTDSRCCAGENNM